MGLLIALAAVLLAVGLLGGLYGLRRRRTTHQPRFAPYRPSQAQIRWAKVRAGLDLDQHYPNE